VHNNSSPSGRHWLYQLHRCGAELLGAARSIGSLPGPDTLGCLFSSIRRWTPTIKPQGHGG
jgi:hypothetical protein